MQFGLIGTTKQTTTCNTILQEPTINVSCSRNRTIPNQLITMFKTGRWGGVWRADRSYSFTATNDGQTSVELTKRFDNWQIGDNSIENRMPWLNAEQLTTSKNGTSAWGTITGSTLYLF